MDSNVIANWILLDAAIEEVTPKGEKALRELRDKTPRKFPSYLLLQQLMQLPRKSPIRFGTSGFAVAEISRVILEEYIDRRMYEKGIPSQYWESLRKGEQLSDEDEEELFSQIDKFLAIFFDFNRGTMRWFEKHDFMTYCMLITSARLSTTDAVLVGEALTSDCRYFVTQDSQLRRLLKRLGKIHPISAQGMLSLLNEA